MSTLSYLPVSLLESLGAGLVQQAADTALGPGVLTISADSSGLSLDVNISESALDTLTSPITIHADDLSIASNGFSGHLFIEGIDATNTLSATLFDGFVIGLTAFDITFANGGIAACNIGGQLTIPFFTDPEGNPSTVDIELGIKGDGNLSITLAAAPTNPTPDGLVQLIYSLPNGSDGNSLGSVELDVASLEIDTSSDGAWKIVISGNLIITTAGLNWPSFELRGLGIDSKGNIDLESGWIDLPSQTSLDFFGFHVALQKLGFGSDANGDRWIGFNGDINLVEGLSLGGSVRGMIINLSTGALSFAGVSISFEIEGVLSFAGEIDHIQVTATKPSDLEAVGLPPSIFNYITGPTTPSGGKQVNVFAGQVKLDIEAVGLTVDANFIVGTFGNQSVFFLYIDAELPAGIPIFLDVSIYGLQGLVATGLDPDPTPDHTWWEWFKYPNGTSGPDPTQAPDYTATDISKWLVPVTGAFALGAGATIGTSVDDGYTASAAIMLVLLLPGPVISLIGMANILSKRISGASQGGNFEAMATYDGNADTFDLTIDAQYQIPYVLEIEATAQLYVGGGEWFFAIGEPPHDKRAKARIFDLFECDAYFVVSDAGLITGTWTGFQGSWSFGPLSASIDAYLATLAAIQWSPLQIAGGIELYGNVQLSAFGISIGVTAQALLEGCAPNPFWVYGDLNVSLDLPWPLPSPSATISFSWGGDDGSVPPAPLALSHIDATLSDHTDSANKPCSDHYALLAHRPEGPSPDLPIVYDPTTPGILDLTGSSLTNWQNRVSGNSTSAILPDLSPDDSSQKQLAPVVPQDAHFTLSFSHPVDDLVGFINSIEYGAANFPSENVEISEPPPPNQVGKDDMSNINPNPPSVQWVIRHSIVEVSLYKYAAAWALVATASNATQPNPPVGGTDLYGVWLSPDPEKGNPRQAQTQLKLVPWTLVPGQCWSATWSSMSPPKTYGTSFVDQGLTFQLSSHLQPATIGNVFYKNTTAGLMFVSQDPKVGYAAQIQFPQPMILTSITALLYQFMSPVLATVAPTCFGDGTQMTPTETSQDASSQAWTLQFSPEGPSIQELTIKVNSGVTGGTLVLYALEYSSPPTPAAILPDENMLYGLKCVSTVEAARTNGGTLAFETVNPGDPIVEFAYFQTASGPGAATVNATPVVTPPNPVDMQGPPYPQLAANWLAVTTPPGAPDPAGNTTSPFPLGGSLADLETYCQWSWPQDGDLAAYYGYDVSVEFDESYVNYLYTVFSAGSALNSLHFRCTDRNNAHTLVMPMAMHVPSFPQQSAVVATSSPVGMPATIAPPAAGTALTLTEAQVKQLSDRAKAATGVSAAQDDTAYITQQSSVAKTISQVRLGRVGGLQIKQIDPGIARWLLHLWQEQQAAAKARDKWFQPFAPRTRYTLDVVVGPFNRRQKSDSDSVPAAEMVGTLLEILTATDAISVLAALIAYYSYEDALPSLARFQFTTSQFATFSDQMANAANQLARGASGSPIRHYTTDQDPAAWLADAVHNDNNRIQAQQAYTNAHTALANQVAGFSPLADDLQATSATAQNGIAALTVQRGTTLSAWQSFAQATATTFSGLITALGRKELADGEKPVTVPDTEISLFINTAGDRVEAILLESPEPFPWQRIWNSVSLTPVGSSAMGLRGTVVLWNTDGTKGLILPIGDPLGSYRLTITFQGNIGAEAPCITLGGIAVSEPMAVGTILLGRKPVRRP